jgi:hypothetical protein
VELRGNVKASALLYRKGLGVLEKSATKNFLMSQCAQTSHIFGSDPGTNDMDEYARLLTKATNFAVVQLPGRRYPGVIFQADSLHNLLYNILRLQTLASNLGNEELSDAIEEMREDIYEVEQGLIHVCNRQGVELPFKVSAQTDKKGGELP